MTFAGLAKSLQQEWQYIQRVLPDTGRLFAPVEEALATEFLPVLAQLLPSTTDAAHIVLSVKRCAVDKRPRQLMSASDRGQVAARCRLGWVWHAEARIFRRQRQHLAEQGG